MDNQQRQFQNKIIALSIIFSTVTGFIAGGLASDFFDKFDFSQAPATTKIVQPSETGKNNQVLAQDEPVVAAVKKASPAVVSIIASKDVPIMKQYWQEVNPFQGTPFEKFFAPYSVPQTRQEGTKKQQIGGGSGFIVSSDGLILTNKHVVDDQQAEYSVFTNDGKEYPAKVLARDPVQDIALIKIDKNNLPTLTLADSDKIAVGQTVVAIGNALAEFRNTVSVGVVSGLGRSIAAAANFGSSPEQLENVIQTDAAINPGNSGGPLLNLSGEVIGINVAIAQGAQNIGFALPINVVKRDLDQVQKIGKISYPYLGVRYVLITSEIKQEKNLTVDYGALILRGQNAGETAITPGSPAEKAGLAENDIILEADGQKINKDNSLARIIQNHNVGDTITLKVLSKGKEKMLKVVLEERNF